MTHPHDTAQIPGIMLYRHLYEALSSLEFEAVGRLTLAMMEYTFFDLEPQIPPELEIAWSFLKNYADRDSARYLEKVRRRRDAAEKRWAKEKAPIDSVPHSPLPLPLGEVPRRGGEGTDKSSHSLPSQSRSARQLPQGGSQESAPSSEHSPSPEIEPSYDGLRPYRDEKGVIRYK